MQVTLKMIENPVKYFFFYFKIIFLHTENRPELLFSQKIKNIRDRK
jgi:hypothetical protein